MGAGDGAEWENAVNREGRTGLSSTAAGKKCSDQIGSGDPSL